MDLNNPLTNKVFFELHDGLPRQGPGRNRYTARAFGMIPASARGQVLDIGCGPGTPTLELARLGGHPVIGMDTHLPFLQELVQRAGAASLSEHIMPICASMASMPIRDGSVDVFWAEGSIYNIGFEKGLGEFRRILKPGGHAALHEVAWLRSDPPEELREFWLQMYPGMTTVEECLRIIGRCGYRTLGHFALPPEAWWDEYYAPLDQRITDLRARYRSDPRALAVVEEEAREVEMYKKYGEYFGAVFFVLRRSDDA